MAVLLLKQNWNCCWIHSQYIYSNLCTGQNRLTSNSRLHHLSHSKCVQASEGKGTLDPEAMEPAGDLVFLINFLVNLNSRPWFNQQVHSRNRRKEGRALSVTWGEQAGTDRCLARLEITLPSCNTVRQWLNLCSHLNWEILGCYTLKQLNWEDEDNVISLSRVERSPEGSTYLFRPCGSSPAEHHATVYWLTPCGSLGQFFFFLSKSRFFICKLWQKKGLSSVSASGEPRFYKHRHFGC